MLHVIGIQRLELSILLVERLQKDFQRDSILSMEALNIENDFECLRLMVLEGHFEDTD